MKPFGKLPTFTHIRLIDAGFTLIELITSLALLLIVSAITLPQMNFVNSVIMSHETKKLASTFSFLQQRAMTTNTKSEITFDLSNDSYTYQTTNNKTYTNKLPRHIQFGFVPNTMGPPASPKKPIKHAVTFPKRTPSPCVTFSPDGNISAGTIYLTDSKKRYMKALSCSVEEASFLRMYSYRNGKWIADRE